MFTHLAKSGFYRTIELVDASLASYRTLRSNSIPFGGHCNRVGKFIIATKLALRFKCSNYRPFGTECQNLALTCEHSPKASVWERWCVASFGLSEGGVGCRISHFGIHTNWKFCRLANEFAVRFRVSIPYVFVPQWNWYRYGIALYVVTVEIFKAMSIN